METDKTKGLICEIYTEHFKIGLENQSFYEDIIFCGYRVDFYTFLHRMLQESLLIYPFPYLTVVILCLFNICELFM